MNTQMDFLDNRITLFSRKFCVFDSTGLVFTGYVKLLSVGVIDWLHISIVGNLKNG